MRVVVAKTRAIYYAGDRHRAHVKLHLDEVDGLGTFVEVEVISPDGADDEAVLRATCERVMAALGLAAPDLVAASYSDLLLARAAVPSGPDAPPQATDVAPSYPKT